MVAAPGAAGALAGDLSSIDQMRSVARQANESGRFDAVIHNAGVGFREPRKITTADGLSHVFAINVLAPYLLTAMITPPRRLVYLSSGMHRGGSPDLADLQWERRSWSPAQAYSDSKLFDVVLAFALARRWPQVLSGAHAVWADMRPRRRANWRAGDIRTGGRRRAAVSQPAGRRTGSPGIAAWPRFRLETARGRPARALAR